ncbi:2152_t:CDS:10, partial [Entrophospora sp. SA101]
MDKFDFFAAIPSIPSNISIPTIPSIPGIQSIPGLNTLTRKSISATKNDDLSILLAQKQKSILPPDILIRILKHLPITSLPNFALVSRRFKVLVYDDELWEQHLKTLGAWNNYNKIVVDEEFKKIYLELIPYYIDFRHKRKDSRLFKEYFDQRNQAKMLAKINNFGKINITSDSDKINSALETVIEYFENSALHHFELAYDSHNISEMQKWAHILLDLNGGNSCIQVFIQKNSIFFDHLYNPEENFINISSSSPPKSPTTLSTTSDLSYQPLKEFFIYIEEELKRQATLIGQVFPHDADVFFTFTERVVEDVISEYISTFLKLSHDHDILLYLKSVVTAYNRCLHVCKLIWRDIKPGLSKIRAEDLIFQMFESFMGSYLEQELNYVEKQSDDEIEKWNQKLNQSVDAQQQTLVDNSNREVYKHSLRRVGGFIEYPDKMEMVFNTLLKKLGPLHMKTVEFFELVHIADLIQQMVQVYYDEEMANNKYVNKADFLNICNKEKKIFEKILDDCVASGLNKGIQVLIDQVEFILITEQLPENFRPIDTLLDLKPTKACLDAVECLSTYTKLVLGCTDKNTLDVFFQEIGLRLFGILIKHLKKYTVNLNGGFQVIRQPNITPYFLALKELGNIYIISTAKDIGLFIREAERFKGVLHAEDVYEFVQKREDWLIIKKEVDKELYGLKAEDCCSSLTDELLVITGVIVVCDLRKLFEFS